MSRKVLFRSLICLLLISSLAAIWLPAAAQSEIAPSLVTNERGTVGITSPLAGDTLTGIVAVTGTATSNSLAYYKVEYSVDGQSWVTVDTDYEHKTAVSEDSLAEWDTSSLPNGMYYLRAVVVDNTGNSVASEPIQVSISNAAAEAVTAEAEATAEATPEATAVATAEAAAPQVMTIEDLAGMDAESLRGFLASTLPGLIPESLTDVETQMLLDYAVAALSTLATDEHGTVGVFSPVSGQVVAGSVDILGTATSNAFGYYKVEYSVDGSNWVTVDTAYEHKQQVVFDVLATWDTSAVADGAYWLRAAVVDNTGNYIASNPVLVTVANAGAAAEEPAVAPAEATVEATPEAAVVATAEAAVVVLPSWVSANESGMVGISEPMSGSTLSGTADIKGIAASNNLNYYKVEYSVDVTNWVTVDTAYEHTTMVVEDSLTDWDTTKVANGVYWLRAVVVDTIGNYVASSPLQVTVSNAEAAEAAETTG